MANELTASANKFIQQRSGNPNLKVASGNDFPLKWALTALYGAISDAFITYNYDKTGKPIPIGVPALRSYVANEYEYFAQDSWKATRDLTLTYGLRYGYYPPRYEKNGNQAQTTIPLMQYLAQRVRAASAGKPSSSNPPITFALAGKANGKTSWYAPDKNNFSPRLALAWTPGFSEGWLAKLTGGPGRSVVRVGAGVVYDCLATSLAASNAAPGLSTQVGLPGN